MGCRTGAVGRSVVCRSSYQKGIDDMTDLATLDRQIEYGVISTEILASMPGLDFVRAMFAGKVPAPPIMQTVEPFGQSADPGVVAFRSIPGFRHYNPIG